MSQKNTITRFLRNIRTPLEKSLFILELDFIQIILVGLRVIYLDILNKMHIQEHKTPLHWRIERN